MMGLINRGSDSLGPKELDDQVATLKVKILIWISFMLIFISHLLILLWMIFMLVDKHLSFLCCMVCFMIRISSLSPLPMHNMLTS